MDNLISGSVVFNGSPQTLAGARVEAWEVGSEAAKPVATAAVRPGGAFTLVLANALVRRLGNGKVALDLRLVWQGALLRLDPPVTWTARDPATGLTLVPGLGADGRDALGARSVYGTVQGMAGRPVADVLVRAYDRDLRKEELLGEARTGADGGYAIGYTAESFARAEKGGADLVVRVYDGLGQGLLYEPLPEDIVFHALSDHRIDVRLTVPVPAVRSEYEALEAELKPLLGDLAPAELAEDAKNRDLTFLSRETGVAAVRIGHFATAHRLGAFVKVEPAVFYALLRMDTLVEAQPAPFEPMRIAVGISDDAKRLLRQAAAVGPKRITADVETAIAQAIVPAAARDALARLLPLLKEFAKDPGDVPQGKGRVVELAARLMQPERVKSLQALFAEGRSNLPGLLEELTSGRWLDLIEAPAGREAPADLHKLADPEPGALLLAAGLGADEGSQRLAALSSKDLARALRKASPKLDAAGLALQQQRIERNLAKSHPTAVWRARVARGPAAASDPEAVGRLFERHADLDLKRSNLDRAFAEAKLDRPQDRRLLREMKSLQRVLKLAPDLDRAQALVAAKVGSAADLVKIGRSRFMDEIAPAAGLTPREAREVFGRAQSAHAAALMVAGEARDLTATAPYAAPSTTAKALMAATPDFPNLATLFKATDICQCEHCRSVYSPAAYLVELIDFLGQRGMVDLTQTPPVKVNLAREQLFARRPELADLDLDCPNAETPLPYIDLVCEVLEQAVAPDPGVAYAGALAAPAVAPAALLAALRAAGWRIGDDAILQAPDLAGNLVLRDAQVTAKLVTLGANAWRAYRLHNTRGTAAELAAAPEYVNAAAYAALKAAPHAFVLPFDLDHAEATAYFERFGLARADLMDHFAVAAGPAAAIAAERLGLTDAHRKLVVTAQATAAAQAAIWALPAAQVVADMTVLATFLAKTGLDYDAADRLLQLAFIDPSRVHFIRHLDLSCDLTQKEVAALDANLLDRTHRFLRLQRATGWADTVLDALLADPAVGNGTLDDAVLVRLGQVSSVAARIGLKPEELAASFGQFPHATLTGPGAAPSFYDRVFLDKAALGRVEEGLRAEAVVTGTGTLAPLAAPLAALLKLSADDFERLRAGITDDKLTFANLSRLYAAARLSARMKLAPLDLLTLRARTGLDPSADPAAMLRFVEAAERMRGSPVKIADLGWVFEHQGPDVAIRTLGDDRATALLVQLQTAYQAAHAASAIAVDPALTADELRTPVKSALLRLAGLGDVQANMILRMLDAQWTSPPDAPAAATLLTLLGGFFDTTAVAAAQNAVAIAAPAALEGARRTFATTLLAAISTYLEGLARREALVDAVAAFFRADPVLVGTVLTGASLRQPGPATPRLVDALTGDALIDRVNVPPVPPPLSPAAFPTEYRALRLLHKLLPLAGAMGLAPEDLAWWLANGAALGWMRLDALPYEAGQAPIPQADWITALHARALFMAWPPTPDPADPTAEVSLRNTLALVLPGAATTRATWLDALARLTGAERPTLDELDTHHGWSTPNLDAWRLPASWERLGQALADLRALGLSTAGAVALTQPALTAADSARLRTALKTRYDDAIWLVTLGEISNAIRGPKRDALVAFLIAERPAFTTPTDIYDHFLIDVEMEAKMPSSRIVQAHGTIQTFVERSRMGLEPAAAADFSDLGWNQWAWMKNYRVWEAQRKVFVYPENWIEPELLDDKSELFEALEALLLQNDVTDLTTADAYVRYLEALDGIAFLEVVACYYVSTIGTMHVFARTKGGDPAQYYHRTLENEREWTTWRTVDLDIASDNLLAFVRNDRLHLAWPVISEETDPDANVTTPGVSESPSSGPMQRAAARLRIQLAMSEYAGGNWKPKKISQDAIITPQAYSTLSSALDRTRFNLMYNEFTDQVWLFSTTEDGESSSHTLNGVFSIVGCKGYPEVLPGPAVWMPDFYPDVLDTALRTQRYIELGRDKVDTLAIRNILTPAVFAVRLQATPGTFRVTHPHQFTALDFIYLLLEILFLHDNGGAREVYQRSVKIPYGTWLPYFFEDSRRAYVVVPGLYARDGDDPTRRTASDFFQLLRDVIALVQKYIAILNASPAPDPTDVLKQLLVDPDYLHIESEFDVYRKLRFGEDFRNLYHPLVCPLRRTLYRDGVGAMMKREQQLQQTDFRFDATFAPTSLVVQPWPIEDVDFSAGGAYSAYDWEIFFHVPLMIAKRLAGEQRFEEAMTWYHRIFDPTGTLEGTVPQRWWVTKPFYLTADADYLAQRINTLLTRLADPASPERHELESAVADWRAKPFRPHVVARHRTVAYQRTVVMNYIGTLVDWGDYLFRQDTMESINQATQMYILADKLLGPKPAVVPSPVTTTPLTWHQLQADLDVFGNALVELENMLPDLSVLPEGGAELPSPPTALAGLYFCIPANEQMLATWDTVADRLFKIRNSQNIDGVERILALFAPPIDPGMLVRAAASGMDIGSVLAGLSAPLPNHRFRVMVAKASDYASEVRALGQALQSALESSDSGALALLRNDLEVKLLKARRDLKVMEIDAATSQVTVLERTREVTAERNAFYAAFEKISAQEQLNLDKLSDAQDLQRDAQIVRATGAVLGIIPDFTVGGHGAGGSPAVHATFGGSTLAHVADAAATVLTMLSGVSAYEGSRAAALGQFDRRFADAQLQLRSSTRELAQVDQQIAAAKLRRDINARELAVHDVETANAQALSKAMTDQYTNIALHQWTAGKVTEVYHRAYQLAFELARKAERCFQHELGSDETFISFGYWDSRRKGLQTAHKLIFDLGRMQARYLEIDKREYEITKHISLRRLDPLALARLQVTGVCDFEVPEALYDLDHPGHHFRRVRSVAVSIPCVAGPYSSVAARLTQVSNRYRKSTAKAAGAGTPKEEYEEAAGGDTRYAYDIGSSQSVATSSGQNDAGVFELDFHDDRYLPFEGTGAIGTWRLELPAGLRQFDYATISDVVLHVRYTAREGGSGLRTLATASLLEKVQEMKQGLAKTGLHVLAQLRRDDFDAWHALKTTGTAMLTLGLDRLPYFAQSLAPTLGAITMLAKVDGNPANLAVTVDGANVSLNFDPVFQLNLNDHAGPTLGVPFALAVPAASLAALTDIALVVKVDFA